MADPRLKQALKDGEFVLAPGVFDLISALIADTIDFKALYVTGYGTVASYLGLPDAGLATYRDMVERIGQIVKRTTRPVIADADTPATSAPAPAHGAPAPRERHRRRRPTRSVDVHR